MKNPIQASAQTLYLDTDGVYKPYSNLPNVAKPQTFSFPTNPVPTWATDDKPEVGWARKNAGSFAILTTSNVVVAAAFFMGFVAGPIFFVVPLVGAMSAMLNWQSASSTTTHVHRRRKGRTTLPLADVGTGGKHTRMNY